MREISARVGDLVRVHNAPDGHVFQDGAVVPAAGGGEPFAGPNGTTADPSTATGRLLDAGGTKTSSPGDFTLVHDATGIYYFDVAITRSGDWCGRIEGTGTATAAQEIKIVVARSAFE